MAALDTTAFDFALKTLYSKRKVVDSTYKQNPLWAMIRKQENFGGKNLVVPMRYADIAGRAAGFSIAQANKAPSAGLVWTLTRAKDYAIASWDTETMLASRGNEASFLTAVKTEMDSALNALRRSLGIAMYRDGSGKLGEISGTPSTTINLTAARDILNFDVNQKLVASPDATAASPTVRSAAKVTKVNRSVNGTVVLTMDQDVSGLSWAANDDLVAEGDITTSGGQKIKGLAAWIPSTAPGATAFFGVDRTTDLTKMAGNIISATGKRLDEVLFEAAVQTAEVGGGEPDTVMMSYANYRKLINILGSKVERMQKKVATYGFEGANVIGPTGMLNVFPDRNCPPGEAYVLTLDTWCFHSLGPAPQVLNFDGQQYAREGAADAWEVRLALFGQLSCEAPGHNAVITNL